MTPEESTILKRRVFEMMAVINPQVFTEEEFSAYYDRRGAPRVIDTFEPARGDLGLDYLGPASPIRAWSGTAWSPGYGLVPKEAESA